MVDALILSADEGRATPRKWLGSCDEAVIQSSPNGETFLELEEFRP